ncbi:MAG: type II toxin-antitoxin system RelE/ParE family toxin [Woeseiaceae bacterium]
MQSANARSCLSTGVAFRLQSPVRVCEYQSSDGRTPLSEWLDGLSDRRARARIVARIDRLGVGLFGEWKSVGGGVCELRIDHGPGYRVYYARHGRTLVLLLCGGDKRTQTRDIRRAHEYWKDYKARERSLPRGGSPRE